MEQQCLLHKGRGARRAGGGNAGSGSVLPSMGSVPQCPSEASGVGPKSKDKPGLGPARYSMAAGRERGKGLNANAAAETCGKRVPVRPPMALSHTTVGFTVT